jgi:hypothetical protein
MYMLSLYAYITSSFMSQYVEDDHIGGPGGGLGGFDEEKQQLAEMDDDGPRPLDQTTLKKYLTYAKVS